MTWNLSWISFRKIMAIWTNKKIRSSMSRSNTFWPKSIKKPMIIGRISWWISITSSTFKIKIQRAFINHLNYSSRTLRHWMPPSIRLKLLSLKNIKYPWTPSIYTTMTFQWKIDMFPPSSRKKINLRTSPITKLSTWKKKTN